MIVALNDASGMTMELAALMHHRLETFINAEDIKHPLATYGAIEAIEEGVRLQAKEREEDAAEALAGEFVVQPDLGMLFPAYRDRKSAQAERIATVSEAELKRVGDRAWQEYTRKFDEPAMKGVESRLRREDAGTRCQIHRTACRGLRVVDEVPGHGRHLRLPLMTMPISTAAWPTP